MSAGQITFLNLFSAIVLSILLTVDVTAMSLILCQPGCTAMCSCSSTSLSPLEHLWDFYCFLYFFIGSNSSFLHALSTSFISYAELPWHALYAGFFGFVFMFVGLSLSIRFLWSVSVNFMSVMCHV